MDKKIKLTFLGDISLNDDYDEAIFNQKNPFIKVDSHLKNSDLVIGNLEAMAEGTDGSNQLKNTTLKINYSNLKLLKYLHIDLLTLANNHVYDQLSSGFKQTVKYLDQENIEYFGANFKNHYTNDTITKKIGGRNISFLNYVHPDTNPLLPNNCEISISIYQKQRIIRTIKEEQKKVDYIILLLHWGIENSRFPAPWQRNDAKDFIAAGANIIIGHHSHVLQGYEKIGNNYIFYNLGNFAFSRHHNGGKYYDLDKNLHRESVILDLFIEDETNTINIVPISLVEIDVVPICSNRIHNLSSLIPVMSNSIIWPFYKFYVKIIYKVYFYFLGNNRNPIKQLKKLDKMKIIKFIKIFRKGN